MHQPNLASVLYFPSAILIWLLMWRIIHEQHPGNWRLPGLMKTAVFNPVWTTVACRSPGLYAIGKDTFRVQKVLRFARGKLNVLHHTADRALVWFPEGSPESGGQDCVNCSMSGRDILRRRSTFWKSHFLQSTEQFQITIFISLSHNRRL